jgi:hypothetical protein
MGLKKERRKWNDVEEQLGKIIKDLLSKQEEGEIWKLNSKDVQ